MFASNCDINNERHALIYIQQIVHTFFAFNDIDYYNFVLRRNALFKFVCFFLCAR